MAIDKSGPGITSSGRPLLVSRSSGITERTLDLNEAALLRMQPEEVRARTKRGLIPGAKPGGRWVFLEPDPAEVLRDRAADLDASEERLRCECAVPQVTR